MLAIITNNPLASTLVAAILIATTGQIWKWWRARKDAKTIYDFLVESKARTGFTFRSTEAIASHTKLTEKRVTELCSTHPRIRRNEKEKQSWSLIS